jgi:DNA polymerase-3 subunit gamma/tau
MYQVIARKYRPQDFSELIGQEHVQKTLANAIESQRLAHGYIFSGQRGTGKTTVARILARCLNCVNGPTATPCGVCSSCIEIGAGNAVDVIEIDAASNRGINEMREIRENVRYRPARDRYKVFIIDEAHQITKEAFNALLKTLEEPPEWVIFVLCTTEAHEIPNTIASRCQHFTFRSVDFAALMERMKWIAEKEEIEAGEEVLSVLAQAGEGSVRDSLSALDQAIACCGKTLRAEDVRSLLGMFGADSLRAVAEAVHKQEAARMFEIVRELERNGQSLQHFCRELSRYWRNLLVAKIAGKATNLIAASESEQNAFLETAALFGEEDLTRYLNLTLEMYKALQVSLQPRLHLEIGLIKLVHAGRLRTIEQAISDLGKPDDAEPSYDSISPVRRLIDVDAIPEEDSATTSRSAPQQAATTGRMQNESPSANDLGRRIYDALILAGMTTSADAIQRSEIRLEGGGLTICAPKPMTLFLKEEAVQRVITQVFDTPVRVRIVAGEHLAPAPVASAPASEQANGDAALRDRALSHPGVKRFQELFPGSHVRTVRNLNE